MQICQNLITLCSTLISTKKNLFVDRSGDQITGIIDWSEGQFGDPLFDFARVRMFIWHFNLGDDTVGKYYSILDLSPKQKLLEELYFTSQVLNYVCWYSEVENDFNRARLSLHQSYLSHWLD